jgi:hypothetical protein
MDRHGQHQISTTKGIREPKRFKGGRTNTCVDSNSGVRARVVSDGTRYWRTRERAKRKDGESHAEPTADVRGVAKWDERRGDEARERTRRRAVDDGERDEPTRTVHVWPKEGQQTCEEGCGRHDVERAWRGGRGS